MLKYRNIWNIAYPIMLGNLAQTIITLTDTAFLGRLSEVALGASAMAGIYYYVFSTLAWGFALGVQVIVARRFGEQNFKRIGVIFEHGAMFVGVLGIILFSLLKFVSPHLLRALISSDNVYALALEFINYRCYGIFFVCFNFLFRSLYIGLSSTKIISYTTILMAVINVSFDYFLVFGKFGFPELGIKGAAIASVMAEISALILFIIFTVKFLPIKKYALFVFHSFESSLLLTMLKVSIPTMLQKLISFGTWLIFFSFVEKLGERPLASTMTSRSVYMMIAMPAFAYCTTANTIVSRLIGEGKTNEVLTAAKKVLKLSFITILPISIIAIVFPRQFLSIYTSSTPLIDMSINSLYVLAASAYALAFGMIYFDTISGTGNTDHGMYLEICVLISYIFVTWLTAHHLKTAVEWVWMAEFTYGIVLGIVSYIYLKRYDWRKRKRM